jgi:L-lactate dehydrogenase complex protein LldG
MSTKSDFISAITKKLGRPMPEYVAPPDFMDHPADGLNVDFTQADLVDQFVRELEALSGNVVRVPNLHELGDAIRSFLEAGNVKNVVIWNDDTDRGTAIRNACESFAGMSDTGNVIIWNNEINREELLSITERSDAGVVYAEFGISETGTVVVYNKSGKGRAVSLLPNNIGIVLYEKDILPRITHVLERISDPAIEHSCINFISGPSRSADIEMSLSIGVHGPGMTTVFLIEKS